MSKYFNVDYNNKVYLICDDCGYALEHHMGSNSVKSKWFYNNEIQSIQLTYYDCIKCGSRHFVQIDTPETLEQLERVSYEFARIVQLRKKGESITKKHSNRFKKLQSDLSISRIKLMEQYTGELMHDSETDADFILKFSVFKS